MNLFTHLGEFSTRLEDSTHADDLPTQLVNHVIRLYVFCLYLNELFLHNCKIDDPVRLLGSEIPGLLPSQALWLYLSSSCLFFVKDDGNSERYNDILKHIFSDGNDVIQWPKEPVLH